MPKSINRFLLLAAAFLLLVFIVAAYIYFKPVKNISGQKADIESNIVEICNEFDSNAEVADTKYKNKILQLTGTVKKSEVQDSVCTMIFDNGGHFILVANFYPDENEKVKKYKVADKVIVKGMYSGYVINDDTFMIPAEIKLDKCSVVE